jgi:hypothetical protein
MKTVLLRRFQSDSKQTLGTFTIFDTQDIFHCLELAWKDNKRGISCIPEGEYQVDWTYSPKYKRKMYLVTNVTGRSGIRIHKGNYFTDIQGCILLGKDHTDINNDGYRDVVSSGQSIKEFEDIMGGESFILKIKNDF